MAPVVAKNRNTTLKKTKSVRPLAVAKAGHNHATHADQIKRLNRSIGQIQGIQRMITEERYCNDILIQMRAAVAALRAVELQVLKTHMRHCVLNAVKAKDIESSNKKVEEIIGLMERY